jgi:hypothetical protein
MQFHSGVINCPLWFESTGLYLSEITDDVRPRVDETRAGGNASPKNLTKVSKEVTDLI